jgi:hypothetical protein
MLKITNSTPEVANMFREIMKNPENMFKMLRIDLKKACEEAVTELLKVELTAYLQREKYEWRGRCMPKNMREVQRVNPEITAMATTEDITLQKE